MHPTPGGRKEYSENEWVNVVRGVWEERKKLWILKYNTEQLFTSDLLTTCPCPSHEEQMSAKMGKPNISMIQRQSQSDDFSYYCYLKKSLFFELHFNNLAKKNQEHFICVTVLRYAEAFDDGDPKLRPREWTQNISHGIQLSNPLSQIWISGVGNWNACKKSP